MPQLLDYSCFLYRMENVKVLPSVGHDILFGSAEQILADYFHRHPEKRPVVIADENTFELCWPKVIGSNAALNNAEVIQLESGEEHKNLDVCTQVWMALADLQLSRNDVIINLGGGVVTDLGGFVAASFKRGIPFIQVPTSLLAMVDASVGGKVGVDLAGLKNLVGSFATPEMVIIDPEFLESLPKRQLKCGFAEVLKHGLILDKPYWEASLNDGKLELEHIKQLVYRSVELKNQVVLDDFREQGDRKKLNYGHTIGHALETYFLGSPTQLLHGEAVSLGMVCEAWLAREQGVLSTADYDTVRSEIMRLYTAPHIEEGVYPELLEIMRNDKKNTGGRINFTFLKGIGTSVINQTASDASIIEALKSLEAVQP